jgi:DNA/RNA-binding domain of Phe-tRNA-synthetase-like protein
MRFTLAPDLAPVVRHGVIWLEGAAVVEREPRLTAPIAAMEAAVRTGADVGVGVPPPQGYGEARRSAAREGGSGPDALAATTTAVRTMYKRVGLDPTKTRPSSEALLRRVRKGDPFPRINTMVDVCNWCSLEFQLPYGLYDASKIAGDVELRLGRDGELYAGIRKDDVHVAGRICLADRIGPFGNPTSDSARTMVTTDTTSGMLVVFAPRETTPQRLTEVLDVTSARMTEFTGCRETGRVMAGS